MTRPKKTFKDQKEAKDMAKAFHEAREGLRLPRRERKTSLTFLREVQEEWEEMKKEPKVEDPYA